LEKFSDQMEGLSTVLDGAIEMLKAVLTEGLPKSMSLFNNKNFLEDSIYGF